MATLKDVEEILKAHPVPTLILSPDNDYCIAAANNAFLEVTGKILPELLNRPLFEVFPAVEVAGRESVKYIREGLDQLRETGLPLKLDSFRYDGEERSGDRCCGNYWQLTSAAVVDESGKLNYIIHTLQAQQKASFSNNSPSESSNSKFKALFENAFNGIILATEDGQVLEANVVAAEIFGYTTDEFKGLHWDDLADINDADFLGLLETRKTEGRVRAEIFGVRNNGERFICRCSSSLFVGDDGQVCSATVVEDVTKRKLAEAELRKNERRFKALIENDESIITLTDCKGFLIYVNPAYEKITGYKAEEISLLNAAELLHPEQLKESEAILPDLLANPGKTFPVTTRIKHKSGSYIWLEGTVTNRLHEEGIGAFVSNYRDVTQDRKMKKLLSASETHLQTIFNNSIEGFVLTDKQLCVKAFNAKATEYFTLKHLPRVFETGCNLLDYIEEPWTEYFKKQIAHVLQDNIVQYQRPLYVEGKGYYCFCFTIYPIKENGAITGVCISGRDITEQKIAEDQLEKSEKKFRGLIENSADGKILLDDQFIVKYASPQIERITHWKWDNLLDTPFASHFAAGDSLYLQQLLERISETPGDQLKNVLISITAENNDLRWLEFTFSNMLHKEELRSIVINFRDVSARKRTELELFKLNSRLISAQKIAGLGYWELDVEKEELYWSDELYEIWGWEKAPFVPFIQFFQSIHPEDQEALLLYHTETLQGKHETDITYRVLKASGEMVYVHALAKSVRDENGKLVRMEGTAQDVTFRVKAEQAVAESEEKYRKIFQNSPLPNWIYDVDTNEILEVNEAAIHTYGYSREEFLSMSIVDFIPEGEGDLLPEGERKADNSCLGGSRGLKHQKKDGEQILVEITSHAISLNHRDCRLLTANDITERASFACRLVESNERFKLATKATSDAIWDADLQKGKVYLGEGFLNLFGYNEAGSDVENFWLSANIHSNDKERVLNEVRLTLQDEQAEFWYSEYLFKKACGEYAIIINEALIVRDENLKPVRMIGAMKDITAQKTEEHRLRLFESVITNISDSVLITSADFEKDKGVEIVYANPGFYNTTGFSADDIVGKSTSLLNGPLTDMGEVQKLGKAIQEGRSCSIQTVFYKKNKETYWGSLAIAPVADSEGVIKNYIAICHDVSDVINYITEIEEQNKKLREIAWIQSHIVRAPLSRILGLTDILTAETQPEIIAELLPLLHQSAEDLDDVIRKIMAKTKEL